jgi:O-methyltransferase involved in polyketide biosynthesis
MFHSTQWVQMDKNKNLLSSAEMTAYWRSQEPDLSGDWLSGRLSSQAGRKLADEFRDRVYPLVERHLAIRNRFFKSRVTRLLDRGVFDACISLGSGLSLLTSYLAAESANTVRFYDLDEPAMYEVRQQRLQLVEREFDPSVWRRIECLSFDLEEAVYAGRRLSEIVPGVHAPIVLIEGLLYFLGKCCIQRIFEWGKDFAVAAFVFDYWPDDAPRKSPVFRNTVRFLASSITEDVQVLMGATELRELIHPWQLQEDVEISEVEPEFTSPALMNSVEGIVPAHLAVVV